MQTRTTDAGLVVPAHAEETEKKRQAMAKADFKLLRRAVRMYNTYHLGQMLWCKFCSGELVRDEKGDVKPASDANLERIGVEARIKAGLRVNEERHEIVCRCTRRVIV